MEHTPNTTSTCRNPISQTGEFLPQADPCGVKDFEFHRVSAVVRRERGDFLREGSGRRAFTLSRRRSKALINSSDGRRLT